jgi:hypothetical protein
MDHDARRTKYEEDRTTIESATPIIAKLTSEHGGRLLGRRPGVSSKSGDFSRLLDDPPAKKHLFNDRYLYAWENSPGNTPDDLPWV